MAKVNVNETTREELVEAAGLRPELAEAIVKFRDERGKLTKAEELDQVQGVGPATLEQLRKTLTFGETADEKAERERAKAAQEAERTARETAERTAEVASPAVRGGVEATRQATEAGTQMASSMARGGLKVVQRASDAAGEMQREAAEGTAELGKLWMELLNEQTRANLEFATTFGRVIDWQEVIQVQSEFMRASFERLNELNRRYLEITQTMMEATAEETRRAQVRKAG
jgi:competence protein ComEA